VVSLVNLMLTFLQANHKQSWTHNNTSHSYTTRVWDWIGIGKEDMVDSVLDCWMGGLVARWWLGAASFGSLVNWIGLESTNISKF